MNHVTLVRFEAAIGTGLLLLTWVASAVLDLRVLEHISFTARGLAAGIGGGLLLASLLPLWTAPWAERVVVLRDLKRLWDTILVPLGRDLAIADIAVLALLSGISEELFFRGVCLPVMGLGLSSLLFGLLHGVSLSYACWATGIGLILGVSYLTTHNLVVPAAIHATYNFIALGYLRYRYRPLVDGGQNIIDNGR